MIIYKVRFIDEEHGEDEVKFVKEVNPTQAIEKAATKIREEFDEAKFEIKLGDKFPKIEVEAICDEKEILA